MQSQHAITKILITTAKHGFSPMSLAFVFLLLPLSFLAGKLTIFSQANYL